MGNTRCMMGEKIYSERGKEGIVNDVDTRLEEVYTARLCTNMMNK